jgi:hypothetical protein
MVTILSRSSVIPKGSIEGIEPATTVAYSLSRIGPVTLCQNCKLADLALHIARSDRSFRPKLERKIKRLGPKGGTIALVPQRVSLSDLEGSLELHLIRKYQVKMIPEDKIQDVDVQVFHQNRAPSAQRAKRSG